MKQRNEGRKEGRTLLRVEKVAKSSETATDLVAENPEGRLVVCVFD